jgi:pathogenesis-related protein 1
MWRVYKNGYFHWLKREPAGTWSQGTWTAPALRQIAVGSAGSPTPPTPPPAGPGSLSAEQQQTLEAHNGERRNYPGVGALQWSPELAQYAQEWAQRLADAGGSGNHRPSYSDNPFRPGEHLGENINWGNSSAPLTGREAGDAVRSWISEKQWYHYANNSCTAPSGYSCGHFTQVIWQATQFVGCGKATAARNGRNYYYIVCNYYPGGNIGNQKPY